MLATAVKKAEASDKIEVIAPGSLNRNIHAFVKVPPAHTMEMKAASAVKGWLRMLSRNEGLAPTHRGAKA